MKAKAAEVTYLTKTRKRRVIRGVREEPQTHIRVYVSDKKALDRLMRKNDLRSQAITFRRIMDKILRRRKR